jgi:predicted phage baseplate assembly protein
VSGDRFPVAADVRGLPAGRRLVIRGTRRDNGQELVHDATLVSATPAAHSADGGLIVFTPSLPVPLVRTSVVVHGNVAVASHGETVAQVLGSGDAAQQHQRFALAHAPLTHRAAATESGAVAELEVRVGDVAWQHRNTLYATGANDRVFTTLTDEQGKVWVQFGDGVSGARLPSSAHNLRARYRKGLGVDGNVRAEALSQAMARPLGFKGVSNPAAASGGTDAETSEVARRSMPLVTRTLGRVVSVLDYEDFARAYAGIAKAQARVLRLPGVAQGSVVALTVAATAGAPLAAGNPVWANLLAALKDSGDPHVALRLLPAEQRHYRVGLKVKVDAAYEAAVVLPRVEAALRAQGAFDARELGQPVHASDVIAAAQAVPGVVAVDLDFLCFAGTLPQLRSTLRAAPTRAVGAQALPAQVLVLDPGPLLRLEVMA